MSIEESGSIFEFETAPLLPPGSRKTLKHLSEEKAYYCAEMLSRGHPERVVENCYSKRLSAWLLEDTIEVSLTLAEHVIEANSQSVPLILSDN